MGQKGRGTTDIGGLSPAGFRATGGFVQRRTLRLSTSRWCLQLHCLVDDSMMKALGKKKNWAKHSTSTKQVAVNLNIISAWYLQTEHLQHPIHSFTYLFIRSSTTWACDSFMWLITFYKWFYLLATVWRGGAWVERWTCDQQVMGSNLTGGKNCVTTLGKLFTPMCLCHQAV